MLRSVKELGNHLLRAHDGNVGRVQDLYFDGSTWVVRYLVVDWETSHENRQILISPEAVTAPLARDGVLAVNLTMDQLQGSPVTDFKQPLSRKHEARLRDYFGWSAYWSAPLAAGTMAVAEPDPGGLPLHRVGSVTGCTLRAVDGDVGHVSDFLIEEESWTIRYLIVDTRSWLPGRHVIFSPGWISRIDWVTGRMETALNRVAVRNSPPYEPARTVSQEYSMRLRQHYRPHLASMEGSRRGF